MKSTSSITASASSSASLTRAQRQVHLLLEQAGEAMTAQAIYQRLKSQKKSIGLATVYRSLRSLQVKGLAQARALSSGEWMYSLTTDDSHYLTCLNCGASVPIDTCPVHALEEKLGQSSNFQIFYHTLEFFGLCAPCAKQSAN